ncbi:MAG: hypothetical protein GQ532_01015 [Methylomarinum sp.]|nr:hypothetical protein [Methylomarinum sp.]
MEWRLVIKKGFLWRSLDSEAIVYNRDDGSTHVLDTVTVEIINLLAEKSRSQLFLEEHVAQMYQNLSTAKLKNSVKMRLEALKNLKFIETFPSTPE